MRVVRFRVARRLGENVFVDDGNFVGGEKPGGHPGIAAAGEDGFELVGRGPLHGGFNLAHFVGVNHERGVAAQEWQHGFPGRNFFRRMRAGLGFGVGAGFRKKVV